MSEPRSNRALTSLLLVGLMVMAPLTGLAAASPSDEPSSSDEVAALPSHLLEVASPMPSPMTLRGPTCSSMSPSRWCLRPYLRCGWKQTVRV